ncbi:MAG: hypothetical protein QW472_05360 [Candidatus Aenigmatarchaeota archaeon]
MLKDVKEAEELSYKYDIPKEDVILISLNASGLNSDLPYKRVRFKLRLYSQPQEVFYFGIPIIRNTPFYLKNNGLFLETQKVGDCLEVENDTCDATYFRRNDTVLVLNSNSRSSCSGCAFCATYRQDATDKFTLDSEEKLEKCIKDLFTLPEKYNSTRPHFHRPLSVSTSISNLYQISIVTGCFGSEEKASEHIKTVAQYFCKNGFNGELLYIGSELVSKKELASIKERVPNFALIFSLECFTRRNELLKNIKSRVTLEDIENVFNYCKELGISRSFTYIVGLEPIEEIVKGFKRFLHLIDRFPIIQIFQPHWEEQKKLRVLDAENIEYYIKVRKEIEKMFITTSLRPRSWENYRGLWYFTFGNEKLGGIRI